MANKILLSVVITAVVVGGGTFYSGMKYAQSNPSTGVFGQGDFQNLRNLSPEERQQRLQQLGIGAGAGGTRAGLNGGQRNGGGFMNGEIISKDDKSLTIKLSDGGSKIVFYSSATEVGKFASGSASDLEVGKKVTVSGTANPDGSVTAQSIQLRPQAQN